MPKVLVTGGLGFVGTWMARCAPPHLDVTYVGRAGYNLWYWHMVDFDYIVHLAPVAPFRVTEAARRSGARLLYCSSGIVYYPEANTEYRRKKLNWEQYCLDSDLDVVIARLFTFYDSAVSHVTFTKQAKANLPLTITGDGRTTRSYMHGTELGAWMWAILLKGERGEAYDVGSCEPVTMLELAQSVIRQNGSSSAIVVRNGVDPVPYYVPRRENVAKTKGLLK